MIITLSEASPSPLWSVKIHLDHMIRHWKLLDRPAPPVWSRICGETQGPFTMTDNAKTMFLQEQTGFAKRRTLVALDDPPYRSTDTVHKSGGGVITEANDPTLAGKKVQWANAAKSDDMAGFTINADVLAMIEKNFPPTPGTYVDPPNWVEKKDHGENKKEEGKKFRSTGCGGLPGKVFEELAARGWPIPTDMVDGTNPKYTGQKRAPNEKPKWMQLAGSSTGYKAIVQDGIEKRLGAKGQIYIEYQRGSGILPQPGDVYVLAIKGSIWNRPVMEGKKQVGTERVANFRHVGVIIDASTNEWITADGGQDGPKVSGFAIGYTKRSFDPATGLVGGKGEKGELDGWISLEALVREA